MYDILFTGDTFLKNRQGGSPFSKGIEKLFGESDNVVVNLETTVGDSVLEKSQKAFQFRTESSSLRYLVDNGVNIANVANNHSLDYGEEGCDETLTELEKKKITVIGRKDNNCQQIKLTNGVVVSVSGYFGDEDGLLAECRIDTIKEDILKAKQNASFIVVCLHWGEEYAPFPSSYQQKFARLLIEYGANVVIGHHPHVMQGYEEYKGGAIFYSLGNFNFNVDHKYHHQLKETKYGYCIGLNIDNEDERILFNIIPISINDSYVPEIIEDSKEKQTILDYLNEISSPLNQGIGKCFWYSQVGMHHYKNNIPAWIKRIKTYGGSHFMMMLTWFMKPMQFYCLMGILISPFYKKYNFPEVKK